VTVNPSCSATGTEPDATGYHAAREIPNHWTYAHQFVLQDRMFEPNASWSLPAHLFTVSGWSARCANADPMSCSDALQTPNGTAFLLLPPARRSGLPKPLFSWTDVTHLLHNARVSWGYYLGPNGQPTGGFLGDAQCYR